MTAKSRRFPWSLRAPAWASPCAHYSLDKFLEPYLILRFLTHKEKNNGSCTAHPAGLLRGSNQTIYINEGRCNYKSLRWYDSQHSKCTKALAREDREVRACPQLQGCTGNGHGESLPGESLSFQKNLGESLTV